MLLEASSLLKVHFRFHRMAQLKDEVNQNAFAAGDSPKNPLTELTTQLKPLSQLGEPMIQLL